MNDIAEPINETPKKKLTKSQLCDILTGLILVFIVTCLIFCPIVLIYVFGGVASLMITLMIGATVVMVIYEAIHHIFNPKPKPISCKR